MEIRVNLVLMALLGVTWMGLRAQSPARIETPADMVELSELEDRFALDRADKHTLVALTDAYLEAAQPVLAVAVLRAAEPALLEEPAVAHQLARAYEQNGRLLDALATADLARARCSRITGAEPVATAVPAYDCDQYIQSKLDTHKSALEKMVRWGIVDPRVDPRAQRAYDQALLRARTAMGELPAISVP